MAQPAKMREDEPRKPEALVVIPLGDFLEMGGGNLRPNLTLTNPQTGEVVATYDLDVR